MRSTSRTTASARAGAWAFASARDYQTVNGVLATGGSFGGGSGPVVDRNMLFVNSGYGIYFHMPGNVLLAFELAP